MSDFTYQQISAQKLAGRDWYLPLAAFSLSPTQPVLLFS